MLERIDFQFGQRIARENFRLKIHHDTYTDSFIMMLTLMFWGSKAGQIDKQVDFCYPSNWWQHFKEDVFPPWMLRLFPVKERKVTKSFHVEQWAVYPKLTVEDGQEFKTITILR